MLRELHGRVGWGRAARPPGRALLLPGSRAVRGVVRPSPRAPASARPATPVGGGTRPPGTRAGPASARPVRPPPAARTTSWRGAPSRGAAQRQEPALDAAGRGTSHRERTVAGRDAGGVAGSPGRRPGRAGPAPLARHPAVRGPVHDVRPDAARAHRASSVRWTSGWSWASRSPAVAAPTPWAAVRRARRVSPDPTTVPDRARLRRTAGPRRRPAVRGRRPPALARCGRRRRRGEGEVGRRFGRGERRRLRAALDRRSGAGLDRRVHAALDRGPVLRWTVGTALRWTGTSVNPPAPTRGSGERAPATGAAGGVAVAVSGIAGSGGPRPRPVGRSATAAVSTGTSASRVVDTAGGSAPSAGGSSGAASIGSSGTATRWTTGRRTSPTLVRTAAGQRVGRTGAALDRVRDRRRVRDTCRDSRRGRALRPLHGRRPRRREQGQLRCRHRRRRGPSEATAVGVDHATRGDVDDGVAGRTGERGRPPGRELGRELAGSGDRRHRRSEAALDRRQERPAHRRGRRCDETRAVAAVGWIRLRRPAGPRPAHRSPLLGEPGVDARDLATKRSRCACSRSRMSSSDQWKW